MDRLLVLDVSDSNIMLVSALNLDSLKVLVLRNCKNVCVLLCEVGYLKNLEVLDIRGTGIPTIPTDIRNLTSLKSLLVSFTGSSVEGKALDEADCFSRALMEMCVLEEILVEVEASHSEILYASLLKVLDLCRLLRLRFCCPNSRSLTNLIDFRGFAWRIFLYSEKLLQQCISKIHKSKRERVMVYVGCHFDTTSSQMMRFKQWYYMFKGHVSSGTLTEVLSKDDVALELLDDNEMEDLWKIDTDLLNRIRGCTFRNCDKMEVVLKGRARDGALLDNIEILNLISLRSLRSVYEGEVEGLSRLETIVITDCSNLRCVCPHGLLMQLPLLQQLEVKSCPALTRIFNHYPTVFPVLPKLAKLVMVDLPQMELIIEHYDSWPALKNMTVVGCQRLVMLPFTTHSAAKLKSIETERIWWERLENANDIKEKFYRLCKFA